MTSSQDDLPNLPFIERFDEWDKLIERVQEVNEYDELTKEYNRLKGVVLDKKEISKDEDKQFLHVIRTHWGWIIRDASDFLIDKIEHRKTKGQSFSKIIRQINDLKMYGQHEHPLIVYEETYSKLQELADDIKEQIFNEEYQDRQSWKFLIVGAIIGFILGMIGSYTLHVFGVC